MHFKTQINLLVFVVFYSYDLSGQTIKTPKIIFDTDTISASNIGTIIPNPKDSAVFYFDGGFANDTVSILINGITYFHGILVSEPSLDFAGSIVIPKIKQGAISLQVNRHRYSAFEFNEQYPVAHINYFNRNLRLIYSNRLYQYD